MTSSHRCAVGMCKSQRRRIRWPAARHVLEVQMISINCCRSRRLDGSDSRVLNLQVQSKKICEKMSGTINKPVNQLIAANSRIFACKKTDEFKILIRLLLHSTKLTPLYVLSLHMDQKAGFSTRRKENF